MYSSLDGSMVRRNLLSRRFCAGVLLCTVLLIIVVTMLVGGARGEGEDVPSALVNGGEEENGHKVPGGHKKDHPKYESKHAKEVRLKREHDEKRKREKQAHEKRKQEEKLRKEEAKKARLEKEAAEKAGEEEQLRKEHEELVEGGEEPLDEDYDEEEVHEDGEEVHDDGEEVHDDGEEVHNDDKEETVEDNKSEEKEAVQQPRNDDDDYYGVGEEEDKGEDRPCTDHAKSGVIGGELVQVVEIPRNRNFRPELEKWTAEDKAIRVVVAPPAKPLKCPKNLGLASIVVGDRAVGYCQNPKRSMRTVVVLANPVHRMYQALVERLGVKDVSRIIRNINSTAGVEEDAEVFLKKVGKEQARYLCGVECDESKLVESALANLLKADVIMFNSRLDLAVPQLKYALPSVVPKSFQGFSQHSKDESNPVLDSDVKAILKQWGQPDCAVFQQALHRFAQLDRQAKSCLE
ncbi:hypothetical protein BASA81_012599 [Batrachochytrium salamandrivorans]|nr:hypothetical protein BASA81_012599 [Batrachochytrium salamandrivorans]